MSVVPFVRFSVCRLLIASLMLSLFVLTPGSLMAHSLPFADPAFQRVWDTADQPVAAGETQRSWLWGPAPFAYAKELYRESPGSFRLVQYFDKSRMEINYPNADSSSLWYVTNGLLVKELVTGNWQLGDSLFVPRPPTTSPIAGDPDDTSSPTYTSFRRVATLDGKSNQSSDRTGQAVTEWIAQDGQATSGDVSVDVRLGWYEAATGHNIAGIFWDWINDPANGVLSYGSYVYPMGYPITEPYWLRARVAGVERSILVQLFERRVLTYTPDNPDGWQVEMGNVGRAYVDWVYGSPRNTEPQWSPDGRQILFSSNRDGNSDLFSISADGTDLRQITQTADLEGNARWHPDGGKIMFSRIPGGSYVSASDGSSEERWQYPLAEWSPDGSSFAYFGPGIRVRSMVDGSEHPVYSGSGLPAQISWSPDGRYLAYVLVPSQPNTGFTLYVVNAEGTQQWRVTPESWADVEALLMSWAPDSSRLAFTAIRDQGESSGLYVANRDGSGLKEIADSSQGPSLPGWSPDGSEILFQPQFGPDGASLWSIKPDGSGLRRIGGAETDTVVQYSWSWATNQIAFIRHLGNGATQLWVMNGDGSDARLIDSPPPW